jgi:NAD(P)-dependent dehydrogenase (short-subunit alcohol dehydrogenase family)
MDLQLIGKRALVTGSTAGIGLATAAGLHREGASVIVNGRNPQRVEAAVGWIKSLPTVGTPDVTGIAADLGTAEGVAELVRQLPEVDILVNNVGIFEPKPFEEIPDDDWLRFFQVNVMSGVRLTRHYLPGMKTRNWGRVVFVSSESAVQIPAEMIHYGMTKTAQLAIARGVAETTSGTGVTVNSVLPGPTESEGVGTFVSDMAKQQGVGKTEFEAEFFKSARPSSLLKRFATVDEVANLIVYVCSSLASATNGAALRVDGGVIRACV